MGLSELLKMNFSIFKGNAVGYRSTNLTTLVKEMNVVIVQLVLKHANTANM
jgi:hypothetical protein